MSAVEFLDGLMGRRFPGGCDDCDAYRDVTRRFGVHVLTVHHDDTCPTWHRIQSAGGA